MNNTILVGSLIGAGVGGIYGTFLSIYRQRSQNSTNTTITHKNKEYTLWYGIIGVIIGGGLSTFCIQKKIVW